MSSDDIYWCSLLAGAIKNHFAIGHFGPKTAPFIGSLTARAPVAGKIIPESVTNNAIFNQVDYLLSSDDVMYNPDHNNSYSQTLQT
jgi:hypothetical protein